MNLRAGRWWLLAATPFLSPVQAPKPAADTFGISPAQFWRTPFGSAPWTPLAGDADGDRRADLIAVGHSGNSVIEIARTAEIGKAIDSNGARPSSGNGLLAAAAGRFSRLTAADVAMIFADGSVKLAWGMAQGSNTYPNCDVVGEIPVADRPRVPARTAVADFDGDARPDILILGGDGRLLLLQNQAGTTGRPRFVPRPIASPLIDVRRFAGGVLGGERVGRCVWQDPGGTVSSAPLQFKPGAITLGPLTTVAIGSKDDPIAVGRFRGGQGADILVGQRLFTNGNPKAATTLKDLPAPEEAKHDTDWVVADLDGNGKDDLIRHRNAPQRFGGGDVYVHFSYNADDPAKGFYCSGNDGLPDILKLGLIKPAGLDLKAMGCKVGKRDVIVEIERFDDSNLDFLKAGMDRVVRYYANLPIDNPDGSKGIAMHVIFRDPWPAKDHDSVMARFDALIPRPERRGIVHAMMAQNDGPLNAVINGDHGMYNGHWREFLHEFGHQLNLVHDGHYPGRSSGFGFDVGSAIYPSLMSYTYSYGLNGDGEGIVYSDGARASFVIDERKVSERLPFPFETVKFLGNGPYYFRIKPSENGKSTLIDWNWNGVLGEEWVSADTNYTHGTDFGPHFTIAKSKVAPVAVAHGNAEAVRPLLVYGDASHLSVRSWLGENRESDLRKWSSEAVDFTAAMTGDPTAAYLGNGVTWLAYPTKLGVVIRKITLDGLGRPELGPPSVLPHTTAVSPTLVALDGRLFLFIWRRKDLPVELSILRPNGNGLAVGAPRPLDFKSEAPIGAAPGPTIPAGTKLWLSRIQADGLENGGRTQVMRFLVDAGGDLKEEYKDYIDGRYARQRPTLLWTPEVGMPDGRIYHLAGGTGPAPDRHDQWITMNVPYKELGGGWYLRRYRQTTFGSAFAPGACLFEGNIVYAIRGDNEDLHVAFYGSGAGPTPMGDFDDLAHIRDFGLSRSLRGLPK